MEYVTSVDMKRFNEALTEYLSSTSKELVVALNGKMRDCLLHACKYTPIMAVGANNGVKDVRALAVYRRRLHHKIPTRGKQPDKPWPFTSQDVTNSMANITHPARGFMKSAFAKAGARFPKNEASKLDPPKNAMKHNATWSKGILAKLSSLYAESWAFWGSKDVEDMAKKKSIARVAIQQGIDWVYNDMRNYLHDKMVKAAAKASAK